MQRHLQKNYFGIISFTLLSLLVGTVNAQTKPKATPSKDNTCGCTYFPLCKAEATKTFNGKTYKGYNDEEGNMVWYNCDNGVVTKKWEETYTPQEYESSYNPFTNTRTTIYSDGKTKKTTHTLVILKPGLPAGASWTQEIQHLDGTYYKYTWKIIGKGLTAKDDNGKTYSDVIKIHCLEADALKPLHSFYYYYAKGTGFIKEEKDDNEKVRFMVLNGIEEQLNKEGKLKGTIDKDLAGKWVLEKEIAGWNFIMELHEDGVGIMHNGEQGFNDMISTLGISVTTATYFFWRIDNGLKIISLDKKQNTFR